FGVRVPYTDQAVDVAYRAFRADPLWLYTSYTDSVPHRMRLANIAFCRRNANICMFVAAALFLAAAILALIGAVTCAALRSPLTPRQGRDGFRTQLCLTWR